LSIVARRGKYLERLGNRFGENSKWREKGGTGKELRTRKTDLVAHRMRLKKESTSALICESGGTCDVEGKKMIHVMLPRTTTPTDEKSRA